MSNKLLADYQAQASVALGKAKALPFGVYHQEEVYQVETERIFHSEWVFACAEQQIGNPGDYFAFTLAGEPIVILKGKDRRVRALSNVCRHRGTLLLDEGFGKIDRNIICPYHAWAYGDTGELKAVPFADRVAVDKAAHCLPNFGLESWHGLLFVKLSNDGYSFTERIKGLDDYIRAYDIERFKTAYFGGSEAWQANWKLAIENGIESYHLFKVHKETLETITPTKSAFYMAGSAEWSLTAGKFVDNCGAIARFFSAEVPDVFKHYVLISLPPSFIGILDGESLSWLQILPTGPDSCVINSGGISEYEGESKEERQFSEAFLLEDKNIVERVQKGMYSAFSQGGTLVDMEQIVVDFRQFLGSRLFGSETEAFRHNTEADMFLSGS